jgi:hypothetical protein
MPGTMPVCFAACRIGIVLVLAVGLSACGGSGAGTTTSSAAGALTGTSTASASSTVTGAGTGTVTGSGGSAVAAIAAANSSVPLRSASAATYAEGLTGCAIRAASTPSGAVELDAWSPESRLPGMSWTFTVTNGTASAAVTRTPRSASRRPPGGPNCTIGPGGVIVAM